jgi:hypothetical protein
MTSSFAIAAWVAAPIHWSLFASSLVVRGIIALCFKVCQSKRVSV